MLQSRSSARSTFWTNTLKQRFGSLLVPVAQELYAQLDWETEARALRNMDVQYPAYYQVPHHGVPSGYLSCCQAYGWELVEQFFGIRQVQPIVLAMAQTLQPQQIIDLGCGTASTSLALAQLLPDSQLTLLDLSPYQLAAARCHVKSHGLGARTLLRHALAEQTGLEDACADLVLASLLFHELPSTIAREVVHETQRLLIPGGHLLVFDAIQHCVPWSHVDYVINKGLSALMHEVYWNDYMQHHLWQTCSEGGFAHVERKIVSAFPWVYQVIIATK